MEVNAIIKELQPGVKTIVSSGYSDDPVMSSYREYGFDGVSAKPYSYEDIESVILAVLS